MRRRMRRRRSLTRAKRARLKPSVFVFPKRRAWPLPDRRHAQIALEYIRDGKGNPKDYPAVRREVQRRFPGTRPRPKKGRRSCSRCASRDCYGLHFHSRSRSRGLRRGRR